jgi:FkbM family methyltransferase
MKELDYKDTILVHGATVPVVNNVVSDHMLQVMRKGFYEHIEVRTLRNILKKEDILLEVGAGIGVLSTVAATIVPPQNITVVEANPELAAVIAETHSLSGAEGIQVISGIGVGDSNLGEETFFLRKHFWASSLIPPATGEDVRQVSVPRIDLNAIIASQCPTVLAMDIEGAELGLLEQLDLRGLRALVIELHPKVYGLGGTDAIFQAMRKQGFVYDPTHSKGEGVVVFSKLDSQAESGLKNAS